MFLQGIWLTSKTNLQTNLFSSKKVCWNRIKIEKNNQLFKIRETATNICDDNIVSCLNVKTISMKMKFSFDRNHKIEVSQIEIRLLFYRRKLLKRKSIVCEIFVWKSWFEYFVWMTLIKLSMYLKSRFGNQLNFFEWTNHTIP